MSRYTPIKNGSAYSNTGTKTLVVAPDFSIRPVLYAVHSGYQPDRGTVQGALDGDYLFQAEWSRKGESYDIVRFGTGESLANSLAPRLWARLHNTHPWAEAWLEPQGRSGTWLPKEIVPEHEYLANRAKRTRLMKFMDRFGLDLTVDTFARDRKDDLRLDPRQLDLDLDLVPVKEDHHIGSMVDIHTTERWWGSQGDGTPAAPLDTDPEYSLASNYAHDEPVYREGSPGVTGWRNFKFVIRIITGNRVSNHSSYGHAIDVWAIPA